MLDYAEVSSLVGKLRGGATAEATFFRKSAELIVVPLDTADGTGSISV